MRSTQFLTLLLALTVSADWQFKSRPDLAPPRLNITIPATKDVEPGYLFIAPFSGYAEGTRHGPLQAAPYIFTDTGELVWSGYTYFSIWATNFQAARYKGKDILFSFEGSHNAAYGHGHGHTTFLDQHYETIKELRAGNHRLTDKHEFHIINEKTALIQIYHPVPWDLKAYGGSPEQQWIVDARFQELDIETGKVLFEWSSLDHVDAEGSCPFLANSSLTITRSVPPPQPRPSRLRLQQLRRLGLLPHKQRRQRRPRLLPNLCPRCQCNLQNQRHHRRHNLASRWQALKLLSWSRSRILLPASCTLHLRVQGEGSHIIVRQLRAWNGKWWRE